MKLRLKTLLIEAIACELGRLVTSALINYNIMSCAVDSTASELGSCGSSMNAPEGNMWNIRQGIVLSAGVAMSRIHNIYV